MLIDEFYRVSSVLQSLQDKTGISTDYLIMLAFVAVSFIVFTSAFKLRSVQ